MNTNIEREETVFFCIGDVIVPYSSIKITHVNDNKSPIKISYNKLVVWLIIVAMIVALFII